VICTYGHGVNVNLTSGTKLNISKKLEDQIDPKNNKETKTLIKTIYIYMCVCVCVCVCARI